jgi:tRNA acetyltransferase TAN1
MCHELNILLKEAGDPDPHVDKTSIRGLVVAKTALNPMETIEKFRLKLHEKPYEFRYALRIIPIQKVTRTDLEEVKAAAAELTAKMSENETFRVTVEKRFTSLHGRDLIEAVAAEVKNKVNLEKPDWVLLIEVLGGYTGLSLVKPSEVLSVQKEKMI